MRSSSECCCVKIRNQTWSERLKLSSSYFRHWCSFTPHTFCVDDHWRFVCLILLVLLLLIIGSFILLNETSDFSLTGERGETAQSTWAHLHTCTRPGTRPLSDCGCGLHRRERRMNNAQLCCYKGIFFSNWSECWRLLRCWFLVVRLLRAVLLFSECESYLTWAQSALLPLL